MIGKLIDVFPLAVSHAVAGSCAYSIYGVRQVQWWVVTYHGCWRATWKSAETDGTWCNMEGISFRWTLTFDLSRWTREREPEVGVHLQTDLKPADSNGRRSALIPYREWVGARQEQLGVVAGRLRRISSGI